MSAADLAQGVGTRTKAANPRACMGAGRGEAGPAGRDRCCSLTESTAAILAVLDPHPSPLHRTSTTLTSLRSLPARQPALSSAAPAGTPLFRLGRYLTNPTPWASSA